MIINNLVYIKFLELSAKNMEKDVWKSNRLLE